MLVITFFFILFLFLGLFLQLLFFWMVLAVIYTVVSPFLLDILFRYTPPQKPTKTERLKEARKEE